jgi:small subunit ribosomal protein S7
MPRRGYSPSIELRADPKYNSILVSRFINALMRKGKRSTAERIMYGAIQMMEKRSGEDGLSVLKTAINNIKPVVEVKSRRVGGATYQVPVEVRPERRTALALRWAISYASSRPEKTMAERLASELLAASKQEGGAIKKREDTHKMAEANKAFSHYRW